MHIEPYTNLLPSLIFSFIIACCTAYYAQKQGRNPGLWFFLGAALSLFAPLILYLLPPVNNQNGIQSRSTTPASKSDISLQLPVSSLTEEAEKSNATDAAEEKLWYYLDKNHCQIGPVSIIALRDSWKSGNLQTSDYVWSEGMPEWEKIANLSLLKEALNKASIAM